MSDATVSTLPTPPPPTGGGAPPGTEPAATRPGAEGAAFVLQLLALGVPAGGPPGGEAAAAAGPGGGEVLPPLAALAAGPGGRPAGSRSGPAVAPGNGIAAAIDARQAPPPVAAGALGAATDAGRPLPAILAALAGRGDGDSGAATTAVDPAATPGHATARAEGTPSIALHHHLAQQPPLSSGQRVDGHAPLPTGPLVLGDTGAGAARVLADHVAWQAGRGLESAELRIRPAELGPLLVHVQVADGEARVHFVASHGATRELITDALPRLGQLLDAAGIQLSDASVASQHRSGGQPQASPWADAAAPEPAPAVATLDADAPAIRRAGTSLIDLFA